MHDASCLCDRPEWDSSQHGASSAEVVQVQAERPIVNADVDQSTALDLRPKVMLLVRSLGRGGAERQLVVLARGLRERGWPVCVVCFYPDGAFKPDLVAAGVPVFDLGKRGRWNIIRPLCRFLVLLRRERPGVIYSFLPMANLLALAMRRTLPSLRVVWGVRASNVDLDRYDWLARVEYGLEAKLSRFADLVLSNSEAGARLRISQGFPEATMRVIPNGIDVKRYRFDAGGRSRLRAEWNVAVDDVLVGIVARLDPMKDHATFLRAAALLANKGRRWRFVCVGSGTNEYKVRLLELAGSLGLWERVIWAGARDDMPATYSALDIASSSSFGEGFSNVIAEAMACGRPCVVTDVGDSALIVGDSGCVVPVRDAPALASGLEKLRVRLDRDGDALRRMVRARVSERFSVDHLLQRTVSELTSLLRSYG